MSARIIFFKNNRTVEKRGFLSPLPEITGVPDSGGGGGFQSL
jgi:hypothetical protein